MTGGFNLIPESVFVERTQERKRAEKVSLFFAVFPVIAAVIWIGLQTYNTYIETDIQVLGSQIDQTTSAIDSLRPAKDRKALLILKTRLLSDIVLMDVDPEDFFSIVQDTIDKSGLDIVIMEFGKEEKGFTIDCVADNNNAITDIVRQFRERDELADVFLNSITKTEEEINFSISFRIIKDQDEQV